MSDEQESPFAALPFKDGETMPLHELHCRMERFYRNGGVTWGDLLFTVAVRRRKKGMTLTIRRKARK